MINGKLRDLSSTPSELAGIEEKSNLTSSEDLFSLFSRASSSTPANRSSGLRRSPASTDLTKVLSMTDLRISRMSSTPPGISEFSTSHSNSFADLSNCCTVDQVKEFYLVRPIDKMEFK